jgi:4-hydroxysphinganine ceramide fatty acyl 2-hydroxylase
MSYRERLYRFRSFWIFPIIATILLYATLHTEKATLSHYFWLFPLGVLLWTLLEYVLHRFIFHIQIPLKNPLLRDFVNSSHLLHHASPRDPEKVLVHPAYGLVISSLLFALLLAVFRDAGAAAVTITGIWTGFLYYEAVHYRVHFNLSGSGLIGRQRRAHFHHHFINNKRCFGVTSPLWDYVFGTYLA